MRKVLLNLCVVVVAVGVGLLLAEFGARMFLNASDFLKLEMVPDKVLGAVPSPSALAGFDNWGFRNREVPKTADIVAVGDSHTYGNTARMVDSWPYVLGQLTGQRVYNLSLGGYGPIQYFYLSKTRALELKPKMIIWGFYMGDDFEGAYSMTYGYDAWAYLRQLPPQKVDPYIWETPPAVGRFRKMRMWLSRHSVVYQLLFHTGIGGEVKGEIQIRNAAELYPGVATSIVVPDKHIEEAFRPLGLLQWLDQDNPSVREGMRISFEVLKETNEICKRNHAQFVVVVIPVKEQVFAEYLEHNSSIPLHDVMDKLLVNERLGREKLFKFLTDENIPYVDPLPALQTAAGQGQGLYARSAGDMHPNKNGYRVIAEAAAERLKRAQTENQPAAQSQ
jgi:hypothetical protein